MKLHPPNRMDIFRIAWPIILANLSVPLLGLADTAVVGHMGNVLELAAIALGSLIFTFVFWGFGFLRMSTTGFTAQAAGAEDEAEIRATLARALLLALFLGLGLVVLRWPIIQGSLAVLDASVGTESITQRYFLIRIWGAPASLCLFAVMGSLVGLGQGKRLLAVQLFLNGLNITLDLFFAWMLEWGAEGIALGTAISEWFSLLFALYLTIQVLRSRRTFADEDETSFWPWSRIRDSAQLWKTMSANIDILIRTLLLVSSFALFTNQAAKFGDSVLAANHILLQLIGFSAYFLDGYAFAAESIIGRAVGSGRRIIFDAAVWRSTQLAAGTSLLLAISLFAFGDRIVSILTNIPSVLDVAVKFVPYATIYVLVSFAAFQLDGIFIGATRTREMRNAAILSILAFLGLWSLLQPFGYAGLWTAFIGYVIARALCLGIFYPKLRESISSA